MKKYTIFCLLALIIALFSLIQAEVSISELKSKFCDKPPSLCEPGTKYTLCEGESKNLCKRPVEGGDGLTDEEKHLIVFLHNALRQQVADGKEPAGNPGPQPGAKQMEKLEWDEELAVTAQHWAYQCKEGHDKCRHKESESVGQNVAGDVIRTDSGTSIVLSVLSWYNEVRNFDRTRAYKNFIADENLMIIGHYTQFMWAKTKKIGCGAVKYTENYMGTDWKYIRLVCNYSPAGNNPTEQMYEPVDPPASTNNTTTDNNKNVTSTENKNATETNNV